MKVNFSELLDGERVRPLWGRRSDPETAIDSLNKIVARTQQSGSEPAAANKSGDPESQPTEKKAAPQDEPVEMTDLADVPIEPPHHILSALESALRAELGPRTSMIRHLIEPLRARVHRLDPTAPSPMFHPLQHAAAGTVLQLINRLEDALYGLRRVAGKRIGLP